MPVFYVVKLEGDKRIDVARAPTQADAEVHRGEFVTRDAAKTFVIEERPGHFELGDGEEHEPKKPAPLPAPLDAPADVEVPHVES